MMMSIIVMHPGQKVGVVVNDDAIYIYIVSTMRTIYLDPAVTVAVLDHDDQAGPTLEKNIWNEKKTTNWSTS